MNAWRKITTAACVAILLFAVGCAKDVELPQQHAKQGTAPQQASQCVVSEGLVVSINGIKVNWPDSETLNWIAVTDSNPVDPQWVALGYAQERPEIKAKHAVHVDRYATIGEYVLLCGHYEPRFPDGNFCWVVSKRDMKYVGHFLDKDSR
jgi:hypothetical protein